MRSPVLFLIFNRPDTTARVFEAIRAARPPRLYIAADGPRPEKEGEAEQCARARAASEQVDWPCEVKTLFRKRNLGCAAAVGTAISWFFQHEPEGVVLEDDVLPHPDFFAFCDALLERYRDVPEVMHISGDNFQLGLLRGDASYYFSRIEHCWGWASWARAWRHFDQSMPGLNDFLARDLPGLIQDEAARAHFRQSLRDTASGRLNTWDFAWTYAVLRQGGLCAMPQRNMTSNIGFGGGAHFAGTCFWEHLACAPLPDPLLHPARPAANDDADQFTYRTVFAPAGLSQVNLLQEGLNRLERGEAYANAELIRMIRASYGESRACDLLEIVTRAHLAASPGSPSVA